MTDSHSNIKNIPEKAAPAETLSTQASAAKTQNSAVEVQEKARRLNNDSKKKGLFTFEASWGHRMLLGVSIALIVLAIVFIIYCVMRLFSVASQPQDYIITTQLTSFMYFYYGCGILAGVLLLPPAIIGIMVAKSGKHTLLACIAPVVAIFLALCLLGGRLIWGTADVWASIWQAVVMLILPLVYFVAALKVHVFTKQKAAQ